MVQTDRLRCSGVASAAKTSHRGNTREISNTHLVFLTYPFKSPTRCHMLLSISQNIPVDSEKQPFQMTFLEIRNSQMIDSFYTNNDKLVYFLVLMI